MSQNKFLNDKFHLFNSENLQTFYSFSRIIEKISKIKGDILECGIGRGRSLIILNFLLNQLSIKKKIYAFDSFDGFGIIHKYDKSPRKPKKGEWSKTPKNQYKITTRFIKKILHTHLHKNNHAKTILIKGPIEDTSKSTSFNKKISFIHCDVDLYSPHKAILDHFWSRLSKNGIILFDDIDSGIKSKKWPGAVIAFKQFFLDKKIKIYSDKFRHNIYIEKL